MCLLQLVLIAMHNQQITLPPTGGFVSRWKPLPIADNRQPVDIKNFFMLEAGRFSLPEDGRHRLWRNGSPRPYPAMRTQTATDQQFMLPGRQVFSATGLTQRVMGKIFGYFQPCFPFPDDQIIAEKHHNEIILTRYLRPKRKTTKRCFKSL